MLRLGYRVASELFSVLFGTEGEGEGSRGAEPSGVRAERGDADNGGRIGGSGNRAYCAIGLSLRLLRFLGDLDGISTASRLIETTDPAPGLRAPLSSQENCCCTGGTLMYGRDERRSARRLAFCERCCAATSFIVVVLLSVFNTPIKEETPRRYSDRMNEENERVDENDE